MLKNHRNTLITCLLAQTTKQSLSKFETWKSWKYKQLWGMEPDTRCLLKKYICAL